MNGCTDENSSGEESFDFYNGIDESCSSHEWNGSSSGSSSSSSSSSPRSETGDFLSNSETIKAETQELGPVVECHDETQDVELPSQVRLETEEDGVCGQERGTERPAENHRKTERSRRKRREKKRGKAGRAGEGSAGLDDAWSNRWLTGKGVLTF